MREQKGAWVRALERFNIVVTKAAASKPAAQLLGTNRFVGSIMQTTMNQKRKIGVTACGETSRYTGMISPCFPFLSTASLRVVGQEGHTPLPV